jgi:Cys-tRNA(Pro)/Cys-tRNA(Cys) deacylase
MKINNVTRLLEARGIPYTAYDLAAEKLGAKEAAQILKVPPEHVFKTIVIKREGRGKPILAVVPGPNEVNLKALAQVVGEKKVNLPTEREAERLTGLQAGGISPLALLQRPFEMVVDIAARNHTEIYISGGQRGLNIRLPVQALIDLTQAAVAKIS